MKKILWTLVLLSTLSYGQEMSISKSHDLYKLKKENTAILIKDINRSIEDKEYRKALNSLDAYLISSDKYSSIKEGDFLKIGNQLLNNYKQSKKKFQKYVDDYTSSLRSDKATISLGNMVLLNHVLNNDAYTVALLDSVTKIKGVASNRDWDYGLKGKVLEEYKRYDLMYSDKKYYTYSSFLMKLGIVKKRKAFLNECVASKNDSLHFSKLVSASLKHSKLLTKFYLTQNDTVSAKKVVDTAFEVLKDSTLFDAYKNRKDITIRMLPQQKKKKKYKRKYTKEQLAQKSLQKKYRQLLKDKKLKELYDLLINSLKDKSGYNQLSLTWLIIMYKEYQYQPAYDKLDEIRRNETEQLLSDFTVEDHGTVVGKINDGLYEFDKDIALFKTLIELYPNEEKSLGRRFRRDFIFAGNKELALKYVERPGLDYRSSASLRVSPHLWKVDWEKVSKEEQLQKWFVEHEKEKFVNVAKTCIYVALEKGLKNDAQNIKCTALKRYPVKEIEDIVVE